MPPQNMRLWPTDYFLLKAIKKQQTQEFFSLHLLKFFFVTVFPLPSLTSVDLKNSHNQEAESSVSFGGNV